MVETVTLEVVRTRKRLRFRLSVLKCLRRDLRREEAAESTLAATPNLAVPPGDLAARPTAVYARRDRPSNHWAAIPGAGLSAPVGQDEQAVVIAEQALPG